MEAEAAVCLGEWLDAAGMFYDGERTCARGNKGLI